VLLYIQQKSSQAMKNQKFSGSANNSTAQGNQMEFFAETTASVRPTATHSGIPTHGLLNSSRSTVATPSDEASNRGRKSRGYWWKRED